MAAAGLQIFLPLSPQHALLLFDREVYGVSDKGERFIEVSSAREVCGVNGLQLLTAEHNLYASGRPEAVGAVDTLPFKWRDQRGGRVAMHRAMDADGKSQLVHLYQEPHDVGLDLSFIRVLRSKKAVPLADRARSHRAEALAADRELGGERKPGEKPTSKGPWFVVEKD
jgi:hypothetical protein